MGVSSYSPIFYLVQLRRELAYLRDVDVVLQLFENDFDSDSELILKANSFDLEEINSIDGGSSSLIITLLRYSYTARLIRKVQLQTIYLLNSEPEYSTVSNQTDAELNKVRFSEKRQFSFKIISKIKEFCDARSINLHLMIIPNKKLSRTNQCCETDWLHKELKFYALSENISFIDLADEFQKVSNQKDLFFSKDIHLTSYGNEVTYLAIKKHLDINN